jgi:hydrogenase expression/formation protein HypC
MCLGIPGKVIEIEKNVAKVDVGGLARDVSLDLCPDVSVGEYVLIHTGFAIQKWMRKKQWKHWSFR